MRKGPDTQGADGKGPGGIFASPLARRLAKDAGIEITRVQGSGPHGRIVARDIEAAKGGAAMRAPGAPTAARPMEMPAGMPDDKIRALFQRERDDLRAVLTPDQQKTFDRNVEEMRQRRPGGGS